MKHLWKMVEKGEKRGKNIKHTLAGNISNSFEIDDEDNYFTTEVLMPLSHYYENRAPVFRDADQKEDIKVVITL